jgi:heme A synthase
MGIIQYLILCAVVAGLCSLIIWMATPPPQVQKIMWIAVIIVLVVILLQALGLFGFDIPIPRVR